MQNAEVGRAGAVEESRSQVLVAGVVGAVILERGDEEARR